MIEPVLTMALAGEATRPGKKRNTYVATVKPDA